MNARTKLTVLDRVHTLAVILLGSAAAITLLNLMGKPESTGLQLAWMGAGLAAGYLVAFVVDTVIAATVGGVRSRLTVETRKSDPSA